MYTQTFPSVYAEVTYLVNHGFCAADVYRLEAIAKEVAKDDEEAGREIMSKAEKLDERISWDYDRAIGN